MIAYHYVSFIFLAIIIFLFANGNLLDLRIRKKDYSNLKIDLFFMLIAILFALCVFYLISFIDNKYIKYAVISVGAVAVYSLRITTTAKELSVKNVKNTLLDALKRLISPIGIIMIVILFGILLLH